MTPQSVERPISMTDDELIRLLNEIVRREEQLGKPIAMPKPRLETIAKAATRIEQLRKALETATGLLWEHCGGLAPRIEALEKVLQSGER